jgi:tetratricopeptide (TPR) repeat protein
MKNYFRLHCCLTLGLALFFTLFLNARAYTATIQNRNEITGTVFNDMGRPMSDVYVELVTDLGTSLNRVRTSSSGRFFFSGLTNGTFKIRVMPYGTDYMEQTQEVILQSISPSQTATDRQHVEIYLRLNERAKLGPFALVPGVVFAQEVPRSAERLYDEGVRHLSEKREREGLDSLKRSLEIFPTYYLALDRLGQEYAFKGVTGLTDRQYLEAGFVLLTKATEVNPRSASSNFALGMTQYHLGMTNEAIGSLRKATNLYGKSADAFLWLGTALVRASILDEAEVAFKRANELTKGKSAQVHWQTAGLYLKQKRYSEAADQLELFLKIQPKSVDEVKIRESIRQLREKAAKPQS